MKWIAALITSALLSSSGGCSNDGKGGSASAGAGGGAGGSGSGGNAYWERFCSPRVAEATHCYSVRDEGEVRAHLVGQPESCDALDRQAEYVFGSDPYGDPQDGGKWTHGGGGFTIGACSARWPISVVDDGSSYLLTWDAWYSPEWLGATLDNGSATTKMWQIGQTSGGDDGGDQRWMEVRNAGYYSGSGAIAHVDIRQYYDAVGPPEGNVTDDVPLAPAAATYDIPAGKWVRFWLYWDTSRSPARFSMWVGDEDRDAVKVFDGLTIGLPDDDVTEFWGPEWNSSTVTSSTTTYLYVRNIVMLKDLARHESYITGAANRPVE